MDIYILLIGLAVLGVVAFLHSYFIHKRKLKAGRQGELIVDRKLRFWLGWGGAKIFHDVTFSTHGEHSTQIDHVVISRRGIICIETKNLNGIISGDINDQNWVHKNLQDKKNFIYNPILQNRGHIKHLASVLKVSSQDIDGFVTNVGDAKLKGNIKPLIGKPAIQIGTSFIFKLWMRPSSKFTKEEVKNYIQLLTEKMAEADVNIKGRHVDYVRKMKGGGALNFLLNYLYFVVIVLIGYLFYKIFYQ